MLTAPQLCSRQDVARPPSVASPVPQGATAASKGGRLKLAVVRKIRAGIAALGRGLDAVLSRRKFAHESVLMGPAGAPCLVWA
jgi:hypothetical protein